MERYKYPRTYHLPQSPGKTSDDKVIEDMSVFDGQRVVITRKMDGENTSIYMDGYTHARSINSSNHESRSWIKSYAAQVVPIIRDFYKKEDMVLCGENLYAQHSIPYNELESYFYLFNVWVDGICAPWGFSKIVADMAGITMVDVLYQGVYDPLVVSAVISNLKDDDEGFVMRYETAILRNQWSKRVAKYVRANHVQTDEHWMNKPLIKNKLRRL